MADDHGGCNSFNEPRKSDLSCDDSPRRHGGKGKTGGGTVSFTFVVGLQRFVSCGRLTFAGSFVGFVSWRFVLIFFSSLFFLSVTQDGHTGCLYFEWWEISASGQVRLRECEVGGKGEERKGKKEGEKGIEKEKKKDTGKRKEKR